MSFLLFCGSSRIKSKCLKLPILDLPALIGSGIKCLDRNTALKMDFNSIVFPPAFTPVIIKTCPLNASVTDLGFFNAGWLNSVRIISVLLGLGARNSKFFALAKFSLAWYASKRSNSLSMKRRNKKCFVKRLEISRQISKSCACFCVFNALNLSLRLAILWGKT